MLESDQRLDPKNLPPLPEGFVEWAQRTGMAKRVERGEKDIVEALREWRRENEQRRIY